MQIEIMTSGSLKKVYAIAAGKINGLSCVDHDSQDKSDSSQEQSILPPESDSSNSTVFEVTLLSTNNQNIKPHGFHMLINTGRRYYLNH